MQAVHRITWAGRSFMRFCRHLRSEGYYSYRCRRICEQQDFDYMNMLFTYGKDPKRLYEFLKYMY